MPITPSQSSLFALAHISPEHFREHFEWAARGRLAEAANVHIHIGESAIPGDAEKPDGRELYRGYVERRAVATHLLRPAPDRRQSSANAYMTKITCR